MPPQHAAIGRDRHALTLSELTDVAVDLIPAPPLLGALKTAEVVIHTPEENVELSVG